MWGPPKSSRPAGNAAAHAIQLLHPHGIVITRDLVQVLFAMPLSTKLDRKLQAADDSSDGESYYEVSDRSSESFLETGEGGDIASSGDDQGSDEELVSLSLYLLQACC